MKRILDSGHPWPPLLRGRLQRVRFAFLQSISLLAVAMLASTLSAPVLAGDAGRVAKPVIPEAVKGEQCVEPVEVMRREHMDFLMHHRNEVMRQGIRTKQYSLKECLACHVPEEPTAASAEEGHFCVNCHRYAGIKPDCFQCHNRRPQEDPFQADGALSNRHYEAGAGADNNSQGAMQ